MEDTSKLSEALKEMQSKVIGLFRPRYYPADQYLPVIQEAGGVLTCIEIGALLGLSTLTIGAEQGRYVRFPYDRIQPKGQTLSDMLKDPITFNHWYKTNIG